eukprot:6207424-Pleurochrysis_carterae.AAC.5
MHRHQLVCSCALPLALALALALSEDCVPLRVLRVSALDFGVCEATSTRERADVTALARDPRVEQRARALAATHGVLVVLLVGLKLLHVHVEDLLQELALLSLGREGQVLVVVHPRQLRDHLRWYTPR